MPQLARSAGLTGFVELALAVGVDPYRIAKEAGIPPAALADPDVKVSARALSMMYELAAERSGADDFGLRLAETRRLSNLGPIALVVREQPTLRKALVQLGRYIWLQNESVSVHLEETDDIAVLRIGTSAWMERQGAELTLGVAVRVMRDLLGDAWRPLEVRLPHAAPRWVDRYRRVLGRVPLFDQDFIGMVFDRADLERPISRADPAMARQLAGYLEQIAAGRGISLSDKVREMIVLLLPSGDCTVERLAERLTVDRRTLHRRLAAEGATFSGLLNDARREVVETLLGRRDRSLQSVADLAGFSSLSAFSHWFRRQFGCTAGQYRAQAAPGRSLAIVV